MNNFLLDHILRCGFFQCVNYFLMSLAVFLSLSFIIRLNYESLWRWIFWIYFQYLVLKIEALWWTKNGSWTSRLCFSVVFFSSYNNFCWVLLQSFNFIQLFWDFWFYTQTIQKWQSEGFHWRTISKFSERLYFRIWTILVLSRVKLRKGRTFLSWFGLWWQIVSWVLIYHFENSDDKLSVEF